ncbi:MAG TPA: S41 family peptidase [Stellaceae bacterium]|nr:S41 family peptidase [Stellaceae bacterium]
MRKSVLALALIAFVAPQMALTQPALPQTKGAKSGAASGSVYEQLNLFGEAFERIRNDAVEPVGDGKLVRTAISGMLSGLDPRSVYLTEAEYKALQSKAPEDSASTGLVLTMDNSIAKVVSPRDGSPAAAVDIKPGDLIFSIDKEPTYDMTLPEIEQKLRGPADSEVALMVRRGSDKPFEVKVKRAAPGTFRNVEKRLETGNVGYVRLAAFDAGTADALAAAIKDLRQQAGNKLIGFIIDLRNNPGGSFDGAVKAADMFIDKGDIAIVKSRKGENTKHIPATPGDLANGQPIVALVNGGTGREAELVAGALQDSRRAVLLGTKTFGESAIETLIPLNGEGAIRLTTSRYLTPSGRTINGKGLEPDLTVSPLKLEKLAQADRRREADLRGALKNTDKEPATSNATPPAKDSENTGDKTSATTPPKDKQAVVATGDIGTQNDEQLIEAIDVLRGLALISGRTAAR